VCFFGKSVKQECLKDFWDYWKEADWPVGGNIVGGLAGFNTIIIFASLKVVGQYSRRSIAFRMYSRTFNPGVGSSCNI